MKKILFILVIAMMLVLCSCKSGDNGSSSEPGNTQKVIYGSVESEWSSWENARDLVESKFADQVLIGKITNISFQVADKRTGLPPIENAKKKYDLEYGEDVDPRRIFELVTLYDVDVYEMYKGDPVKSTRIRMPGGIKDFREEEQLAALKEYTLEEIFIYEDSPELKIGETYLFVLCQLETAPPCPVNLRQAIYNLYNPFEKDLKVNPNITAKDVISAFGKNKWDDFWMQWQKDNPNWETRLDKTVVDKLLSEE